MHCVGPKHSCKTPRTCSALEPECRGLSHFFAIAVRDRRKTIIYWPVITVPDIVSSFHEAVVSKDAILGFMRPTTETGRPPDAESLEPKGAQRTLNRREFLERASLSSAALALAPTFAEGSTDPGLGAARPR